ncbi:hypothetical protein [Bradyrhizobium sp. HKCCYLR1051]|uniref:hypothetical protein n=1 Tax=Bradyrhizobium sp. HKCCYLR1051 TaxID=3420738 RepID=UPI003EB6BD36
MANLLAKRIPDGTGIYSHTQCTCTLLGPRFPRKRGLLDFASALNDPDARNDEDTYERVCILMTGGFAD